MSESKRQDAWDVLDPWGMFRQVRDAYLESTAKTMVEIVNTEEYAETTGAMLSGWVELAAPVREWMEKVMPPVLAHYGLPSRKEVLSVASRMNNIEMRLDDMEAVLEEIRHALHAEQEQQCRAA